MLKACTQRRAMRRWKVASTVLLLLALLMLLYAPPAEAQGGVLTEGVPSVGALSPEAPGAFYTFVAAPGALVTIQAVGLTDGMAPSLTLLSPLQQPLASSSADPLGLGGTVRLTYLIRDTGPHFVLVGGTPGSYMVRYGSLAPGAITPLTPGVPTPGQIAQGITLAYSFTADPIQPLNLTISSPDPNLPFAARLLGESGQQLATWAGPSSAVRGVIIPEGAGTYYVMVSSSVAAPGGLLTVQIAAAGVASSPPIVAPPVVQPPPVQPPPAQPPVVQPPPAGICVAYAQQANTVVNIRSGPGTNYAIAAQIPAGGTFQITGRDFTGQWYAGTLPGGAIGWVSSTVVALTGSCSQLALIGASPAGPAITATPTLPGPLLATATYTPTATPPGALPPPPPTATPPGALPPPPTATPPGALPPPPTATYTPTYTPPPPTPTYTPTYTPPPPTATQAAAFPPSPTQYLFEISRDYRVGDTVTFSETLPSPGWHLVRVRVPGLSNQPGNLSSREFTIVVQCFSDTLRWGSGGTNGATPNTCNQAITRRFTFDSNTVSLSIRLEGGPGVTYTLIATRIS